MRVGRHSIEISHADKILFPDSGIRKKDVVRYYSRVATTMLRYLKGRPISMHRFPDGLKGEGFFQKSIPDYFPDWIERVEMKKEGGRVTHVLCENEATLVYLANQACLTPHIWLSRKGRPDHPDLAVFDLDPSRKPEPRLRNAVSLIRELIESLGLRCWVKTSGSKGYHLALALDGRTPFDEVRAFCRDLAEKATENYPDLLTVETRKESRGDRIFVDYLRNAYGQTVVAPYSIRVREGAPVSTPITWEEFEDGVEPRDFKLGDMEKRLENQEDPWSGIFQHRYSASKARERLENLG